MNFRSIADLAEVISRNLHKIPSDVDLVVGIPRSGLLAANVLALELNLPLTHIDGFIKGEIFKSGMTRANSAWITDPRQSKHVLVLDDSVHTGGTLKATKARIAGAGFQGRITYAAVFAAPSANRLVDQYFEICPMPRIFGWNYLHHPHLKNWCVDIDGVLCCDPTEQQNDDGPEYLRFLESANVLRIPSYEIGWLVTSRLEKYRPQTESWLRQHNVKYRNLVMLTGHDAESRRRLRIHGRFKASVYSKVEADLFIESDASQASEIAALSGKSVICTETQQIVRPNFLSISHSKQKFLNSRKSVWGVLVRAARAFVGRVKTRIERII